MGDIHSLYRKQVKSLNFKHYDGEIDNCELTTLGSDEDFEELQRELKLMFATKEIFIQSAPCYMFSNKLPPCHECKRIQQGANYAMSGICCCFEGFRKVRFLEDERLIVVGYLNPSQD